MDDVYWQAKYNNYMNTNTNGYLLNSIGNLLLLSRKKKIRSKEIYLLTESVFAKMQTATISATIMGHIAK